MYDITESMAKEFKVNVENPYDMNYEATEVKEGDDLNARKQKLLERGKEKLYPRLKQKIMRSNVPNMLEICCNSIEAMRLRSVLVDCIVQRETLHKVYLEQMRLMNKDGKVYFKDHFNFETFLSGGDKWINFVDHGPGANTAIE